MLRITFKYVGQGDCILIEWRKDDQDRVGIIDCNQTGTSNPVVERLRAKGTEELEFIILSHPHEDHFSGLNAIISYCQQAGVYVKFFGHTARSLTEYVKAVVMGQKDKDQLANLFRAVVALDRQGLVGRRGSVNNLTASLPLIRGVRLGFLAPSEEEHESFIKSQYDESLKPREGRSANWLSTVLIIENDDWHILLTADAERKTLKRIGLDDLKKDRRPLILGQAPHHGSKYNHYRAFWINRMHDTDAPVAISFGPNSYGHPAPEVISCFESMGYTVATTGALFEPLTEEETGALVALDMISEREQRPDPEATDLVYEVKPEAGSIRGLPTRRTV